MHIETMTSKLKHSKKLSKRFRKDFNFSSTIFPELKKYITIERGLLQSKYLKRDESLFSLISDVDTDKDIDYYTNIGDNNEILRM